MREIFGSKKEEIIEGCRKLHDKELHNLYPYQVLIVIKSYRMRWTGHTACVGL